MMHRRHLALAFTILVAGGCRREASPAATGASSTEPSAATAAAAAPAAALPSATAALDRMDTRAPLPLLPMMANHQKQNMRDHLVAVQELVAALSTDDFAAMEAAARRLGFSEQMGQMCTHMGMAAPGFTDQALAFHHTADGITAAAHDRDRAGVVTALGATLQACTGCHATWKQQVVDELTWGRLTGAPPPTHGATP